MKLGLFFTVGVSLETWEKAGLFDREIKPYQRLAEHFEEIIFFTYGDKNDLKFQKLLSDKIKILPKKYNIPNLIYSFLLPFLYQKELKEIDILKVNQMIGSWTAVAAKLFFKKKLIVRQGYQSSLFVKNEGYNPLRILVVSFLEKLAYKNADAIIASSKGDKKYIEEKYHISAGKIKYIPNYIDAELFKPLNIEKENRIIFVGRLNKQKNIFNLIEAVSGIAYKLVIIGSGSLKNDLEKFSRQIKANVEFKNNIPNEDLPEELNKSRLFIFPSLYEGCPKALLEAMACGLPVIGTNVCGINEIIKHKENGYLCGTDVVSIRMAITEVLNDKNLQEKIKFNARKTIVENFSLEKNLEKEINIYETL